MVKRTVSHHTRDAVIQAIEACGHQYNRVLVGIAGPPGSGKSTFASEIVTRLGRDAAVLPMDGFHLDNAVLQRMGLLQRKGAPETFDSEGFGRVVRALRAQESVSYPTFDRQNDCTVSGGGQIHATTRFVVIEGNYLLLRTPPWYNLAGLFDLSVYLDVPREVLKSRLVSRWREHGMGTKDAEARAERNDMANVDLVQECSLTADYIVHNSK